MFVLRLSFNGAFFHGWQSQPNVRTVQDELKLAFSKIFKCKKEIPFPSGCSRTDTGVHALDYISTMPEIHPIPPENLKKGLNSVLPEDVRVREIKKTNGYKDARALAAAKHYRYVIYTGDTRTPFNAPFSWHSAYGLNIEAMKSAASHFIGEHDFSAFCATGSSVKTTKRKVYALEITPAENYVFINITGNGFLKHMVRIISGTIVQVGRGKIDPDHIKDIISDCDRQKAGATLPGRGLYLEKVFSSEKSAEKAVFSREHGSFIWNWPDLCRD